MIFSLSLTSCSSKNQNKGTNLTEKPLVDIRDAEKTVNKLCDLIQKLDNPELNDQEYQKIQIQIQALYLGIDFSVRVGFYEENEIITAAKKLKCLI